MSLVCSQIQLQNLHPSLSPPFIPGQTGSTSHKWQWKKWHSLCYCPQYDWPEVAVPHLTAAEALAQPVEPPFPLPPASLQTLSIFPTCHHCLLLSTRNISFEIKGEKYPFKDYFQISQLCCLGLLGCCFFFCLCVSFLLELLSFALCYPALIMPCNLQNRSSWGWPDISLRSSDHTSLAFARREICSIQVPDERKILKKKKKKKAIFGFLWGLGILTSRVQRSSSKCPGSFPCHEALWFPRSMTAWGLPTGPLGILEVSSCIEHEPLWGTQCEPFNIKYTVRFWCYNLCTCFFLEIFTLILHLLPVSLYVHSDSNSFEIGYFLNSGSFYINCKKILNLSVSELLLALNFATYERFGYFLLHWPAESNWSGWKPEKNSPTAQKL